MLVSAFVTALAFQEGPARPAAPADDCCARNHLDAPPPATGDAKAARLRLIADGILKSRAPFVGDGTVELLEKRAATLPPNGDPKVEFQVRFNLADARLNHGTVEAAIGDLDRCLELANRFPDPTVKEAVLRKLAIAWMRIGERANCIQNHNQDSCLLPLQGGAIHKDQRGSTKAVEYLRLLLSAHPNDLPSIWLLNLAAMTLGTYPESVPKPFRIDPRAFESEVPMARMPDVAKQLGVDAFGRAGGSCLDDFDGDGRLDLVWSSMDVADPMRMFRRKPDGTFEDVTVKVGLAGQLGGLQFIHFDANNDGRLDLLVQRGAWMREFGVIPNSLLIQQEDGTFVDQTQAAGIEISAPSQVAAVADIDNDGDLDLFLGYESNTGGGADRFPSRMFRNRGDGTFEDITAQAGVENLRYCKGAAFGDYDGDRLPDLYISNMGGANRLLHNNGDGRFTDVAIELGVQAPFDSFACWFFDYNNDGALDLFVTNYAQSNRTAEVCAGYMNGASGLDTMRLYENDGRGNFRNVTRARRLDRPCFPMGCNFGDIDNDGFPDIYLGTGDPDFTSLWPNLMLRNDRGQGFQDVTAATDTGHLQKGHGVSFGDIDGDGDQDLYAQLGGAVKDDATASALFQNPGCGNHWITVRVAGHRTNRFGLGVRLRATIAEPATAGGQETQRDVYAFVGANSSFGGNSLQEEMGLGRATRIVALEAFWPVTGKTDRFTDVPLDRCIVVDEDAGWRLASTPPRSKP